MDEVLTRQQAATLIIAAKVAAGLRWEELAKMLDRSVVWTTSALLGQQSLSGEQADAVCAHLDLPPSVATALRLPPVRGSDAVDITEPLAYRLTEVVQVYGRTIAELVGEEFGDGIISAIDFELDFERRTDPKGDRVILTLNGKFLPYRVW